MKNIVVFDIETTGLDRTKHFIIQFAGLKMNRETNQIIDELNLYIKPEGNYTIDIAAYFKHKITPDFLSDKPTIKEVGQQIVDFIGDCDVLTYNGNGFDIPFLISQLKINGFNIDFTNRGCYDAFLEEKRRNGIGLDNTYKRYKGKTMEESGLIAHDAFSDVKATYSVFVAQQKNKEYGPEVMYGEDSVIKIMEFNGEEVPCMSIGKYRGVSLDYISKIDQGYLKWAISEKSNFINSTKEIIKQYVIED